MSLPPRDAAMRRAAIWTLLVLIGLVALFLLFEFVVPALLPENF